MSQSDFPQYTHAAQRGNKGVRIVENIVHDQLNWIFREQEGQKDFGIDAHIELMEGGNVLGRMLAAQIKCGESFFQAKTADGYVFTGERKHLNYFLNYSVPVILILCNPITEKCWWCEIDPLDMDETPTGWQITVPYDQHFDASAKEKLAALAGPSQNYAPRLQEYWALNKILQQDVSVLAVIALREDVEAGDTSRTLAILTRLCASKKLIRKYQEKVDIRILGYERDPRQLWKIPEVQAWIRHLDHEFPYWFYFLSRQMPGLRFITYSICDIFELLDGSKELEETGYGAFLVAHFAAMNEICESIGYGEKEIFALTKSVVTYLTGGQEPDWSQTASQSI